MAFPTLIVINGTLKKVDGSPESGHIIFQSSVDVLSSTDSTVVVPSYRVATLDENGTFSIALPASNDPSWNPSPWTYRVSEQLSAGKREFRTIVPYDAIGGQFDYTHLVPAIDVDAQLYAPYNHVHPGGGGDSVDWVDIVNKPTTFPPSTHNHDDRYYTEAETLALFAAIDYPVDSVAGRTGAIVLSISDITGLQSSLDGKENTGVAASLLAVHNSDTTGVHGISDTAALATTSDISSAISGIDFPVDSVSGRTGAVTLTKSDVGLANVDNTSDANKPVSTATSTALAGKVSTSTTVNGHALSANVTVTKSDVGLGNVDNTADSAKTFTISQTTGLQAALDSKVATTTTVNGHALSSNVTVTKGDVGLGNVNNVGLLVLNTGDPIPGGTPSGTVIVRI